MSKYFTYESVQRMFFVDWNYLLFITCKPRGPLSVYLYIFHLRFMIKDYFHAQMMWFVVMLGNVSSPNIMINLA